MEGHAPLAHRTNSGAVMIVCQCGWRTPPQYPVTYDHKKRNVSGRGGPRDRVLIEHGEHVKRVRAGHE